MMISAMSGMSDMSNMPMASAAAPTATPSGMAMSGMSGMGDMDSSMDMTSGACKISVRDALVWTKTSNLLSSLYLDAVELVHRRCL